MTRAFRLVLAAACVVAVGIVGTARYALHGNRYKTALELSEEREEEDRRAYFKAQYARAKTADEQIFVSYEERISRRGDFAREMDKVKIEDGVDRFEAWMLAHQYFGRQFGVCGVVYLPMPDGTRWRVPIAIGSGARHGTIWIDAVTGQPTCDTPSPFAKEQNQPTPAQRP